MNEKIEQINKWIESTPVPRAFNGNEEFMGFTVELMNYVLHVLTEGIKIYPSNKKSNSKGYTKQKAIIVGHMVRMTKLFEGFLMHIASRQFELSAIFSRLIYETSVKIEYLCNSSKETFQSYILTSYKSEKEILEDFNEIKKERPLIPIEKRIRKKIVSRLRQDKITIKELLSNRTWNIDGKHFKAILKDLNREDEYCHGFGQMSHFVHGGWYEISLHHLRKEGRYYKPEFDFDTPDPRLACPITILCLKTLKNYLAWNKVDTESEIMIIVESFLKMTLRIDAEDEARRQ